MEHSRDVLRREMGRRSAGIDASAAGAAAMGWRRARRRRNALRRGGMGVHHHHVGSVRRGNGTAHPRRRVVGSRFPTCTLCSGSADRCAHHCKIQSSFIRPTVSTRAQRADYADAPMAMASDSRFSSKPRRNTSLLVLQNTSCRSAGSGTTSSTICTCSLIPYGTAP